MTQPLVTVAICTYARPISLRRALDSLLAQTLPRRDFEILVVDNTPDPGGLADVRVSYASSDVMTWAHEPTPGLSRARNLAIRAARGEILAFIDDDAMARPNWLASMLDTFRASGPKTEAAGGRVDPIWTRPRPAWLHEELLGYLSIVNWGGERRTLDGAEWIAGTNMAFRTDALRATRGFLNELGRCGPGHSLLSNEEQEILNHIRARGGHVVYAPDMCVDHTIGAERLTQSWFRKRVSWQAISDYIRSGDETERNIATHWNRLIEFRRSVGDVDTLSALHLPIDDPDLFRRQTYAIYAQTILLLTGFIEAAAWDQANVARDTALKQQRDELEQQLATVYRSASWRATAPLRSIKRRAMRLINGA